jgi:hypothetical protein
MEIPREIFVEVVTAVLTSVAIIFLLSI